MREEDENKDKRGFIQANIDAIAELEKKNMIKMQEDL